MKQVKLPGRRTRVYGAIYNQGYTEGLDSQRRRDESRFAAAKAEHDRAADQRRAAFVKQVTDLVGHLGQLTDAVAHMIIAEERKI